MRFDKKFTNPGLVISSSDIYLPFFFVFIILPIPTIALLSQFQANQRNKCNSNLAWRYSLRCGPLEVLFVKWHVIVRFGLLLAEHAQIDQILRPMNLRVLLQVVHQHANTPQMANALKHLLERFRLRREVRYDLVDVVEPPEPAHLHRQRTSKGHVPFAYLGLRPVTPHNLGDFALQCHLRGNGGKHYKKSISMQQG